MNRLETLNSYYADTQDETLDNMLSADGFDEAILGVDVPTGRVVYSIWRCLEVLQTRDQMTYEEAFEYFEFNVRDAYVGKHTPIWCDDVIFYTY